MVLQDYWDLFVLVELSALRAGLDSLLRPTFAVHLYVGVIAAFLAWEYFFPWRPRQKKLRNGVGLDLFYTLFNYLIFWMLIGTALVEVTSVVFRDALAHYFGIEHLVAIRLEALPIWLRYLLLVLALDLTSWLGHWLLHHVDFLWAFHKVHHSARELDVLNAGRIHFVEKLFYPFVFYVPIGMIGFAVQDTFAVGLFIAVFSAFTHANVRLPLGPLKYVLNNPQIHLWHHAAAVDYKRNVNYGDALCLWDYLFGTAYLPDDRNEIELGFDDIDEYPTSFGGQLMAPFRSLLAPNG
ncbi:MAG: sterol desaturase family protein [Myxococcota bacterium]|nr:sterol desaturase family protein [Myxococcota bacterium]